MSKLPKKSNDKYFKKSFENRRHYISRITKTLYYAKLPAADGLSLPVTELAAELFSDVHRGRSLDRLHCDDAAYISRNACVSPCSLVIALLYLERLKKCNLDYVEKTTSSDLFLISLMVSCKFLYDDGETDEVFIDEWAKSARTSVKHLVQLERDFLKAIDWKLFVNELSFWKKLNEIETVIARKQGILRGFFTYTELESLLTDLNLQNLVYVVSAVSAILAASYVVAVFTILGSVFFITNIPGTILEIQQKSTSPIVQHDIQEKIQLDPAMFLKTQTGMLLTSAESGLNSFCNVTVDNEILNSYKENTSWDWWNIPAMQWLTESLATSSNIQAPTTLNYYNKYLGIEKMASNVFREKNSWHGKWTDPLDENGFYNRYLHYYIQTVKS